MRFSSLLAFILLLLFSHAAFGQDVKTGIVHGWLSFPPNGEKPYGGVCSYINEGDTVSTLVLMNEIVLKGCRPGNGKVTFSNISYEPFEKEVQVSADSVTLVEVCLKTKDAEELAAAGVTAKRVPRITVVGDTIRYNAAALDLMEGEPALEILRHMPGAQIDENGITIMSENVSRTYVDGTLLFGNDVMTALSSLPASDVISIDTYRELNPFGKSSRFNRKKDRVLNIRTRSKLVQATRVNSFLAGGADIADPDKFRYGTGINANFFSKDLILGLNANTNNMNIESNRIGNLAPNLVKSDRDNLLNYVDASIDRKWGDDVFTDVVDLSANYSFNNRKSFSHSTVSQDYLDEDVSIGRINNNSDTSSSHVANARMSVIKNGISFTYESSMEWADKSAFQSFLQENEVAGHRKSDFTRNLDLDDRFALSQSMLFSIFKDTFYHSVNVFWNLARNNGSGNRSDSFDGNHPLADFVNDNSSHDNDIQAGYLFGKSIGMNMNFSVGYVCRYETMNHEKTSLNVTDPAAPVADLTNTYSFMSNYLHSEPEISFSWTSSDYSNGFTGRLKVQHVIAARTDIMPEFPAFKKRLVYPLPSVQYNRNNGLNNFTLSYRTMLTLPTFEQWRPQLLNLNPLQPVSGNSELKPTYNHTIDARAGFVGNNGNTVSLHGAVSYSRNTISLATRYIDSPEYLPEWDYTVQQGASLSQWVNSGDALMCQAGCDLNFGIKELKASAVIRPVYSFSSTPYVFGNQSSVMNSNSFEISSRLNSLVSKRFSYRLGLDSGYTMSAVAGLSCNNSFKTTMDVGFQWYFWKSMFMRPFYRFRCVTNSSGTVDGYCDNLLNAIAGVSLFNRKMDVSVSAYDLLGRNTNFVSRVVQNYLENTSVTGLSRYVTLNISYKFYHSKSGLKSPSGNMGLNDGSLRGFRNMGR